jgi:hypothetical protein
MDVFDLKVKVIVAPGCQLKVQIDHVLNVEYYCTINETIKAIDNFRKNDCHILLCCNQQDVNAIKDCFLPNDIDRIYIMNTHMIYTPHSNMCDPVLNAANLLKALMVRGCLLYL